jgi:hypothetical protein
MSRDALRQSSDVMPLIKARTRRVNTVRHLCRLQERNRDTRLLHARFFDDHR